MDMNDDIKNMISIYTPEEWQELIRNEMKKLGLEFDRETEYKKEDLFEDGE